MNEINQSPVSGEKTKEDRIMSTINFLFDGQNDQKVIENLRMYYDANRGSRVSIFHENIKNSEKTMVMTDAVYDKMKSLVKNTLETKKEHAFLVLGWVQGNNYLFSGIASDVDIDDTIKNAIYDKNPEWRADDSAVDFNVLLSVYWQAVNSHIDKVKASGLKPLVSLGHTHPDVSESYGNYSLPDLVGFSEQEEAIRGNRDDGDFEYCHVVLPVNGDVDCMTFDGGTGQFKKIINVLAVGQNKEDAVPAYTFESPKSLSTTSYEKEEGELEDDGIYNGCIEKILQEHKWDTLNRSL